MALPKVYDYDAASDETIVTAGVEGFEIQWVGLDINARIIHIVVNEGTLATDGESIETVTRKGQQVTLEGDDALAFYQANKTAIDSLVGGAMAKWASENSKTGSVVS